MKRSEWKSRIRGMTVSVVGLGVSNRPLIELLLSCGARVTARDQKTREQLGELACALETRGVTLVTGDGYLEDLCEDVIFRSPGLRPDLPAFREAVQRGAVLTSEMELFLELTPTPVLAVTGSDGKTTTTTLVGEFLKAEAKKTGRGRVYVGGNIGTPLLPHVFEMTEDDVAVVELSSFQLQTLAISPIRAALTNITPNHLNWHTDMEEYIRAKTNIFRHPQNRVLTVNAENAVTRDLGQNAPQTVAWFSSEKTRPEAFHGLCKEGDLAFYARDGRILRYDGRSETAVLDVGKIILPGKHNLENYMTAIALTDGYVSAESIAEVAKSFRGVAHRLERVRVLDGVTYYNSSIDSTPTRTAAALSALREKPIVICGGYDKKIPFAPLADVLCERAKAVVLTGATASSIRQALLEREEARDGRLPIYTEPCFSDAVLRARALAKSGDTVLLSPACASFDAFRNFEERGDTFRRLVESFS